MALLDGVIDAWGDTATRVAGAADLLLSKYDHYIYVCPSISNPIDRIEDIFGVELDAKGIDWRSTTPTEIGEMLLNAGLIKGYRYDSAGGNTGSMLLSTWSDSVADAFAKASPVQAAEIRALESFNGSTLDRFVRASIFTNIEGIIGYDFILPDQASSLLNQSYAALKESVYSALATQTRLKPYLDSVELVIDADGIRFDTSALSARLDAGKAADFKSAVGDLVDLNRYAPTVLEASGFDGKQKLSSWLDSIDATSPLNDIDWSSINTVTPGADFYLGGKSSDSISTQGGDDFIWGGAGNDSIDGGAGSDLPNLDIGFVNAGQTAEVKFDLSLYQVRHRARPRRCGDVRRGDGREKRQLLPGYLDAGRQGHAH